MKTRKYAIAMGFAMTALTLAVMAPSSSAQSKRLIAKVPFDFYVAGKLMPSGSYTVTPSPVHKTIQVNSGKNSAFVLAIPMNGPAGDENGRGNILVFNRYGNRHFLSELYWEGSVNGWGALETKLELEARRSTPRSPVAITLSK